MRKYKLNEHFFDELNEKSAYWLGFLYADGYVTIAGNESFIISLKKFLVDSGVYKIYIYTSGKIKILSISNLTDVFKFKNIIYNGDTVFLERKKNKFNEVITNFVSEEEFSDLIKKNNLITFNKYVSYITFNKLSGFPRNPESEYNFKF